MKLTGLLAVLSETEEYQRLRDALRAGARPTSAAVPLAALTYVAAALSGDLARPVLLVTARSDRAKQVQEEMEIWLDDPGRVLYYPEPDAMPYEPAAFDSPSQNHRLKVLLEISEWDKRYEPHPGLLLPPIVVTCGYGLMHQVSTPDEMSAGTRIILAGSRIDLSTSLSKWVSLGYEPVHTVERPGTFSRRGGILDIFPPTSLLPVRVELFGDRVESLRHFDPLSQRSVRMINSIIIGPASESGKGENPANIADYLPPDALLIIEEPASVQSTIEMLNGQAQEIREQRNEAEQRGERDTVERPPYYDWPEVSARLGRIQRRLSIGAWEEEDGSARLPFRPAPFFGGRLRLFLDAAQETRQKGIAMVIISHQAGRLTDVLGEVGLASPILTELTEKPLPGDRLIVSGSLQGGWSLGPLTLLTDAEIFGWVKPRRAVARKSSGRELILSQVQPGDHVVHVEHGIARFGGLERLSSDGSEKEYMVLEYAGGDRLFVPLEQVDRVSRYLGGGAGEPELTRLSSADWSRAKDRARRAAADVAQDLLEIYAQREVSTGEALGPDTPWQREMEDAFPYIETPDQAEAIAQVKADLESPKPMDRLICGDVGYGKTEIALRAAFKAVASGKQVAVLVPTTVLAQQHYGTFNERLAAFPVKVEVLSRFRTGKQQEAVLEGLQTGAVDICIGTHRLLQKDVHFKDLGLLIVDEEQRFGVMHKEHLKRLRKEVHVLTLTATPIPRSLYMSLVSVRDMSVIETPPDERLPIKTVIMPYDEPTVRHAILRELDRGGQVYFVHNRVQGIYRIADRLRELVPEAKLAVGHGQMPEDELERVMLDFFAGKVDVLLCTTIIEAGLDVPNANTIIINMADKMGLAQLYQLRGRVGRGSNLAHAYLLFSRDGSMTPTAEERLRTILEASDLGAGYRIAMKDLEIRGAGNLLGAEQSGHIAAVGFDLYCSMLTEAVEELRMKRAGRAAPPPRPATVIDLPLTAYLPEGYILDQSARISLYQRLAKADSLEALLELREEVKDRFGPEPPEVAELLYVAGLKIRASKAGVMSIAQRDGEVIVSLGPAGRLDRGKLTPLERPGLKVGSTQVRLEVKKLGVRWRALLGEVLQTMAKSRP